MRLKKLLEGVNVRLDPQLWEEEIASVAANSKDVRKGSLFIAIKGSVYDGHSFVGEAFRKGASFSVVESGKKIPGRARNVISVKDTRKALSVIAKNFYGSPSEKLKLIGVTGTNGKTTTSAIVESILKAGGIPCGIIGTIEYKIGKESIPAHMTTPDALGLNLMLDKMRRNRLKAVVMEVSSHGLSQKRVDDIFFDAAVFTNLTHEHLDYHRSLEQYFSAKTKIFRNLKKGGSAVINKDDKYGQRAMKSLADVRTITYGLAQNPDVSAKIKKIDLDGSSFTVTAGGKNLFSVHTKLVGLHNVSNILAATAACLSLNTEAHAIKAGIENLDNVRGRLEALCMGQGFKVFVDYAHTHNALLNVLQFLNRIKKRRVITVFGCGGDRDRKKRPLMGGVAERLSDIVILTDDNPRGEDPDRIIREIEKGMAGKATKHTVIRKREKAIERALKTAKRDDIVLIAGKGHEGVQVIGKKVTPFNDSKVTRALLRSRK